MRYGIVACTRPDSLWGRTVRWRCGRYGQPLAFPSLAQAREAADAFNSQYGPLNHIYVHEAVPLNDKEGAG